MCEILIIPRKLPGCDSIIRCLVPLKLQILDVRKPVRYDVSSESRSVFFVQDGAHFSLVDLSSSVIRERTKPRPKCPF